MHTVIFRAWNCIRFLTDKKTHARGCSLFLKRQMSCIFTPNQTNPAKNLLYLLFMAMAVPDKSFMKTQFLFPNAMPPIMVRGVLSITDLIRMILNVPIYAKNTPFFWPKRAGA